MAIVNLHSPRNKGLIAGLIKGNQWLPLISPAISGGVCLGFIGDDILPSYMGIITNHYKDPYCWWLKSCTSWYGKYPIIYRVSYIPGGAGFQPSTVLNKHFLELHLDSRANFMTIHRRLVNSKEIQPLKMPETFRFRNLPENYWRFAQILIFLMEVIKFFPGGKKSSNPKNSGQTFWTSKSSLSWVVSPWFCLDLLQLGKSFKESSLKTTIRQPH